MARSLGDLGTPHEPVDLTFNYFGVVIRVNPTASDLDLIGFMLESADVETVDENKAMQATARYLKGLVHEDDWETFWRTAKANRQVLPDLLLLGENIVEAVSGVPSEPPSVSSGGRQTTAPKSKAESSSPRARTRGKDTGRNAEVRRALELVPEGRADLKEFIIQAQEARAAAEQTAAGTTTAARMGLTG
jgi:hypothetical protein